MLQIIEDSGSFQNDCLNCEYCFEVLLNVKPLPCGLILCDDCKHLISNKRFKCYKCITFHNAPTKTNKIENIQRKSPKFNQLVVQIESKLKELRSPLINGDDLIREHCNELRRQVQLDKEEKIQQIEDTATKMLNNINQFETKSIETFQNKNLKEYSTKLNNLKQELNEWVAKLTKYKVKFSKSALKELENLKLKIDSSKQNNLFNLAFKNNDILVYKTNQSLVDTNLMGNLKVKPNSIILYDHLVKQDFSKQFYKFKLNLIKENMTDSNLFTRFNVLDTKLLPNNDIIVLGEDITYTNCHNDLYLILIDSIGNWKRHLILPTRVDMEFVKIDIDSKIFMSKDRICLNYHAYSEDIILVLDLNLNKVKQISTLNDKKVIGCNNEKIFVLSRDDNAIQVYNWSLEYVRKFGQMKDPNREFYVPKYCRQMFTVETSEHQKYIVFELRNQFRILNATSGKSKSFRTNEIIKLAIDSNNDLVVFKKEKIVYYDLNGLFLREIDLGDHRYKLNGLYFYLNSTKSDLYYFDHECFIFSHI